MRKLIFLALLCALATLAPAQNTTTMGNITTLGTPCGSANCVYYQVPPATPWVVVTVTGTWSGTLETATTSAPNANYTNLSAITWTTLGTTTANGTWTAATTGATYLRVRATSWASGSAHVAMAADGSLGGLTSPMFPGALTAAGLQGADGGSGADCWLTNGSYAPCGSGAYLPVNDPSFTGALSGPMVNNVIHTAAYAGIYPNASTDSTAGFNVALADAQANGYSLYIDPGVYSFNNVIYDTGVPVFGAGAATVLKSTAFIATYNLSAWTATSGGVYTITVPGPTPQIFGGAFETLGYNITLAGIAGYAGSCNPNGPQWASNIVYAGGSTTMNFTCTGGGAGAGTSGTVSNTRPNAAVFMQGSGAELHNLSILSTWTGGRIGGLGSGVLNYGSNFVIENVTIDGGATNGLATAALGGGSPSGWNNTGDTCAVSGGVGAILAVTASGGAPTAVAISAAGNGFYAYSTPTAASCTAISPATGTPIAVNITVASGGGGYQCLGCHDGTVLGGTVKNVNADGYYSGGCAYNVATIGTRVYNSGDDMWSNNSALTDACPTHHMTYVGNIGDTGAERGFEIEGGYDIDWEGGSLSNTQASAILVDGGFSDAFASTSNITIGPTTIDGSDLSQGAGGAAVTVGAQTASSGTTTGVTVTGISAINSYGAGVVIGNSTEPGQTSDVSVCASQFSGAGSGHPFDGVTLLGTADITLCDLKLSGFSRFAVSATTAENSGTLSLSNVESDANNTGNYATGAFTFPQSGFTHYSFSGIHAKNGTNPITYLLAMGTDAPTVNLRGYSGGGIATATVGTGTPTGWTTGDTCTVYGAGGAGGGIGAGAVLTITASGGVPSALAVTEPGSNYGAGTNVLCSAVSPSTGVGLYATYTVSSVTAVAPGGALLTSSTNGANFPSGVRSPLTVTNAGQRAAALVNLTDVVGGLGAVLDFVAPSGILFAEGTNGAGHLSIYDAAAGSGNGAVGTATYISGGTPFTGSGVCTVGTFNNSSTASGTFIVSGGTPLPVITITGGGSGATAPPTSISGITSCTGGVTYAAGALTIVSTLAGSTALDVAPNGAITLGASSGAGVAIAPGNPFILGAGIPLYLNTSGYGTAGQVPQSQGSGLTPLWVSPSHAVSTYATGTAISSATLTMTGFGAGNNGFAAGISASGYFVSAATSVSRLQVRCAHTGVNSSSGVFTLYKAAAGTGAFTATALTVTYGTTAANTIVADTTDSYAASGGDVLQIRVTTQASEVLADCSASLVFTP